MIIDRIMAEENNIQPMGGIKFDFKKSENPCIIKVVGVGGGGGNAVNHMYREGIHDVTYVVCNTDKKALMDSPVPNRLQLGPGLGAGNNPVMKGGIPVAGLFAKLHPMVFGKRNGFIRQHKQHTSV
jgi:cell division GTPase FtsZ